MKSETEDKIPQSSTQENKDKIKVYKSADFYGMYIESVPKKFYVSITVYRKIIKTFLTIYFWEAYFKNFPIYFPFGGRLKIVTYKSWTRYQKHGGSKVKKITESIKALGLFWHLIPSMRLHYMVKIKKLTGSTNMIPKIEAAYTQTNDKDLLPIFIDEKNIQFKDKTLYKCIRHWYPFNK